VRVKFVAFEAAAIEVGGRAMVIWQNGAHRVVCMLTREEEAEAREAMRRGDGVRIERTCERAEQLELRLEKAEMMELGWDRELDSGSSSAEQEAIERQDTKESRTRETGRETGRKGEQERGTKQAGADRQGWDTERTLGREEWIEQGEFEYILISVSDCVVRRIEY
jgi:hypothetical protein